MALRPFKLETHGEQPLPRAVDREPVHRAACPRRPSARHQGRVACDRSGRDALRRGGIRVRQVDDGDGDHRPSARGRPGSVRLDPARRPRSPEPRRGRLVRRARARGRYGVPGADDLPQPGDAGGGPDRRDLPRPWTSHAGGAREARARPPRRGEPAEPRADRQGLSARALRRPAPARDDRHGPCARAEAPHRRRADHGPRRDHAGAGAQADRQPAPQEGNGGSLHHP